MHTVNHLQLSRPNGTLCVCTTQAKYDCSRTQTLTSNEVTIELSETVSPHQDNGDTSFLLILVTPARSGGVNGDEGCDCYGGEGRDCLFCGRFKKKSAENVCRFCPIPFIVISH